MPFDDENHRAPTDANWKTWALRPLILFVASYTIIGILHESAHALTAWVLKVPFVLFHLYVRLEPGAGTLNQRAIIRATGPLFSFCVGLVCLLAYRQAKRTRAGLWLLYLGWFGVATLFGNLISTAFGGDFNGLAVAFQLPMSFRYGFSVTGAVLLCGYAFLMGRELRSWAPERVGTVQALIGLIAVPVIAGTALALLIYLPMPLDFASARLAESSFWIFAALGLFLARNQFRNTEPHPPLWIDFVILLIAAAVIRLMAAGIVHVP